MRLAEAVCGRDNNFNLIRAMAAAGVLVSHAYPISLGPDASQPLYRLTGHSLGTICVWVFFAVSGLLITQSYARSRSLGRWTLSRVLRIFPALAVVLLLTLLVLGPVTTQISVQSYFHSPETLSYFLRNIFLFDLQYSLPGVFEQNAFGPAINGSLWTLKYEVACYAAVALIGALGALAPRWRVSVALALLFAAYAAVAFLGAANSLHPALVLVKSLGFPFLLGATFFDRRHRISLNIWIALLLSGVALGLHNTPLWTEAFCVALTYWVLWLSYIPAGRVRLYNRIGDYSYGIYIYAFPTQQLVAYLLPSSTPLVNIAIAAPIVLGTAMASWHLVEKPALSLKARSGKNRKDTTQTTLEPPATSGGEGR